MRYPTPPPPLTTAFMESIWKRDLLTSLSRVTAFILVDRFCGWRRSPPERMMESRSSTASLALTWKGGGKRLPFLPDSSPFVVSHTGNPYVTYRFPMHDALEDPQGLVGRAVGVKDRRLSPHLVPGGQRLVQTLLEPGRRERCSGKAL